MEKTTFYLAEIRKEHIKATEDGFDVYLGRIKGHFASSDASVPEFDSLALFYIANFGEAKERIVAVDAIYPNNGDFKSARLFGNADEIPMRKEKSVVNAWIDPLPLPRHRIKINVVKFQEEQLFECNGLMFDLLNAHDEFEGGQLSIVRQGDAIDRTREIRVEGTHAECMCFCGLEKYRAINALSPEDFKTGDILLLDILAIPDFNFIESLREHACFLSSMLKVFDEKSEMKVGEFEERVAEKMSIAEKDFVSVAIIRFREKK